jgi:heat-inducible transcriptional repressor
MIRLLKEEIMLTPRAQTVLRSIVRQHVTKAKPVSSASVVEDCGLEVCSATARNEMMRLEQDGYIIRPHHAAGAVPSDKGYRYYVETLKGVRLPPQEQFMIDHLFHQVEAELEQWLNLTVALLAKRVHNVAVVTSPRPVACKLHHLELVSLQGPLALAVLILRGAKVKQKLITFEQPMSQDTLVAIANKLNDSFVGLTCSQIKARELELSADEKQVSRCLESMMKAEDEQEFEDSYLDGLQFMLEQPEFNIGHRAQALMQLIENRELGRSIVPEGMSGQGVNVVIGKENREEAIQDYSVVISNYGLPEEALGTIGVVGPTRMPYEQSIAVVSYLSAVVSALVAELYGKDTSKSDREGYN